MSEKTNKTDPHRHTHGRYNVCLPRVTTTPTTIIVAKINTKVSDSQTKFMMLNIVKIKIVSFVCTQTHTVPRFEFAFTNEFSVINIQRIQRMRKKQGELSIHFIFHSCIQCVGARDDDND